MSEIRSLPDSITDWSKWITGISLFSASGCVSVLVTKGVGAKNLDNIKLAIIFFLLTVLVAWLIQLAVAIGKHNSINKAAPSDGAASLGLITKILIVSEILLFCFSCFYLVRWVWNFPANQATLLINSIP